MIGYKSSIHQRNSLCKQEWVPKFLWQLLVSSKACFLNTRLQRASVLQHLQYIRLYNDCRDISVYKGQGGKLQLNECYLWALRPQYLRNCHATVTNIATWPREYFGKPLPFNTVHRCIQKCNWNCIMQPRSHIPALCRNTGKFSGPKLILILVWKTVEPCGVVRWLHILACFQKKVAIELSVSKMKLTIQIPISERCKSQHLWWHGGASVPTAWVNCMYVKVPLTLRCMLEF